MKKIIAFAACMAMALCLTGCAQKIEGSCSTVFNACQELPTDANVIVVASGKLAEFSTVERSESGGAVLTLSDDGGYGEVVMAMFDNVSDEMLKELQSYGRKTVEGKLRAEWVNSSYITLTDCKLL